MPLLGKYADDPNWDELMEAIRANREEIDAEVSKAQSTAYLLDTDTLSNALRGNVSIQKQILATPAEEICISVISVEEILRGRLDLIRKKQKSSRSLSAAYDALFTSLTDFSQLNVLPYDSQAQRV